MFSEPLQVSPDRSGVDAHAAKPISELHFQRCSDVEGIQESSRDGPGFVRTGMYTEKPTLRCNSWSDCGRIKEMNVRQLEWIIGIDVYKRRGGKSDSYDACRSFLRRTGYCEVRRDKWIGGPIQ
jgi:hypothetical protein